MRQLLDDFQGWRWLAGCVHAYIDYASSLSSPLITPMSKFFRCQNQLSRAYGKRDGYRHRHFTSEPRSVLRFIHLGWVNTRGPVRRELGSQLLPQDVQDEHGVSFKHKFVRLAALTTLTATCCLPLNPYCSLTALSMNCSRLRTGLAAAFHFHHG